MSDDDLFPRKKEFDSLDDGHGPYWHWSALVEDEKKAVARQDWEDFVVWATDNLGQGYSLACWEGDAVDPVTCWAFRGFMAGRGRYS